MATRDEPQYRPAAAARAGQCGNRIFVSRRAILLIYLLPDDRGHAALNVLAVMDPRIRMGNRMSLSTAANQQPNAFRSPPTGHWCGGVSASISLRWSAASSCWFLYAVVLCPDFFSTQEPELAQRRSFRCRGSICSMAHGIRPLGPGDRRPAQSRDIAPWNGAPTRRRKFVSEFSVRARHTGFWD